MVAQELRLLNRCSHWYRPTCRRSTIPPDHASSLRNIVITIRDRNVAKLTVGSNSFFAKLDDNTSANELRELLQSGPVTMPASNYGGFEKVCSLGTRLTAHDIQATTQSGDIMLYSSNQIVIFYGSNSWAYTRLAKVIGEDTQSTTQSNSVT